MKHRGRSMKVRALIDFDDYEKGVKRSAGEVFIVSKERFAAINSTKWGQMVEEAPEEPEGE